MAVTITKPEIILNVVQVHPSAQWIFVHIAQFGSVQHAWQPLSKRKAKNWNSRRATGQDCDSLADLCEEACTALVCIMLGSS